MAKIEIQSQKAIDNIKALIRELQSLDTAVNNIGKSSKSSLSTLESQLRKVVKATSDLKGKYDTLNTSLNTLKKKTDPTKRVICVSILEKHKFFSFLTKRQCTEAT